MDYVEEIKIDGTSVEYIVPKHGGLQKSDYLNDYGAVSILIQLSFDMFAWDKNPNIWILMYVPLIELKLKINCHFETLVSSSSFGFYKNLSMSNGILKI